MHRELIWAFDTARFSVRFYAEEETDLDLSFDEDGATREGLASGELVAFCACVEVRLDGNTIAADYLGQCIYRSAEEFCTGHRDPDPMNRNCSLMRAARGENVSIGHYFPDMVATAIQEARRALRNMPALRAA
jgi:hypothetical protein